MTKLITRSGRRGADALRLMAVLAVLPACFRDLNPPGGLALEITSPTPGQVFDRADIEVTGIVERKATVTVNGAPATLGDGTFTAPVELSLGANVITVVATSTKKPYNTVTRTVNVTFTPPRPIITLVSPTDGAFVNAQPIEVRGRVAVAASVTVNGQPAVMSGLDFSATVPLVVGSNEITIVATDPVYPTNTDTLVFSVVFARPVPVITLTAPSDGAVVTAQPVEVRGSVAADATVMVNGQTATMSGRDFAATLPLAVGSNTVTIVATDPLYPTNTHTLTFTVTFAPPPPVITIDSPSDGAVVSAQPVTLRGSVAVNADVTVNGVPVALDGLSFSLAQALTLGANTITIVATDPAYPSNTVSRTITVTFTPPVPTITLSSPSDGQTLLVRPALVQGSVAVPADVTINGQPAVMSGLSFSASVQLTLGANTIVIVATDPAYPSNTHSQIVTITYAPVRPTITVDEPVDGAILRERPVLVTGTLAIPADLVINGVAAQVDGLTFSAVVPIVVGTNDLVMVATDPTDPANVDNLTVTVGFPALTLSVDESVVGGDGAFEIVPRQDGTAMLAGRYAPLDYAVTIQLTSGAQTLSVRSNDGTFRTPLPPSAELWTLTATEETAEPRSATAGVRVAVDVTPPSFTIEGGLVQVVTDDVVVLSGVAGDAQSDVATITATSSRFPGVDFAVIRGGSDGFYVEIPIENGDNVIRLRAVDQYGNAAEIEVTVVRPSGLLPTLIVASPLSGSVVVTPKIVVEGLVYTSQPPESVRVLVGDQQLFAQATARAGILAYRFEEVPVRAGYNALWVRAETLVGNDEVTVPIVYLADAPPETDTRPIIVVVTPLPGTATADPSVTLSGSILRGVGQVTLEIDGTPVALFGEQRRFRHSVDITAQPPGVITFQLVATDAQAQSRSTEVRVTKDLGIPVITFTTPGLDEPPAVNRVVETPFIIEGTVLDDNLGSLTLNGEPVRVLPAGEPNLYTFNVRLELENGQQRAANFVAADRAGNRTTRSLEFLGDVPVGIEIITPRAGAEIMSNDAQVPVSVVTRLTALGAQHRVQALADGGAAVPLALDGATASGAVAVTATDGPHQIVVEVLDTADVVVARARVDFSIFNTVNIPLEVVVTVPTNGATGVEPNAFLTLHFSKVIDPALLSVEVRETAHGLTYDLSQGGGEDFTSRTLPPLVEVHRDQEQVGATISLFPGNRMVAYYMARDFAYNAKVYVAATYDGAEIWRFSFDTRPLPTFVQGLVSDQFSNEVPGVRVTLADRTAVTDENGSFAFGFGDAPEQALPPGRHRLTVNPGLASTRYGSVETWVNVEAGRLAQIGAIPLPILNPDIPFRRLLSGAANQVFAGGALSIDTSGGTLRFPDGRTQGDVHVQFTPIHQIPAAAQPYATPQWMYAVQPVGVELRGTLRVRVEMPALYGSYGYVPADGTRVLLLGLDPNAMQLVPVGVGTITAHTIEGVIQNTRLDFLGYALMAAQHQPVLERFTRGEISLPELNGALAGATP